MLEIESRENACHLTHISRKITCVNLSCNLKLSLQPFRLLLFICLLSVCVVIYGRKNTLLKQIVCLSFDSLFFVFNKNSFVELKNALFVWYFSLQFVHLLPYFDVDFDLHLHLLFTAHLIQCCCCYLLLSLVTINLAWPLSIWHLFWHCNSETRQKSPSKLQKLIFSSTKYVFLPIVNFL